MTIVFAMEQQSFGPREEEYARGFQESECPLMLSQPFALCVDSYISRTYTCMTCIHSVNCYTWRVCLHGDSGFSMEQRAEGLIYKLHNLNGLILLPINKQSDHKTIYTQCARVIDRFSEQHFYCFQAFNQNAFCWDGWGVGGGVDFSYPIRHLRPYIPALALRPKNVIPLFV